MAEPEWISARQAAELTGIPEDTIEWWIRQGSFTQRERRGNRPTLSRTSVEAFARTYVPKKTRQARRRRLQEQRKRTAAPTRAQWYANHLSLQDLATDLEVSVHTVRRNASLGQITAERHPTRPWLRVTPEEADRLRAEQARWISATAAAELIGCTLNHVKGAIKSGSIATRPNRGALPCVDRNSALHYAQSTYPQILRDLEQARQAKRPRGIQPLDDEHVWLRATTVALILGVSTPRISQLLKKGALPHTRAGKRAWVRRDHLEVWQAARRAAARRSPTRARPSGRIEVTLGLPETFW